MCCKDCLYAEVCPGFEVTQINCDKFKDRQKFVELPCKVGDMVYTNVVMWSWYRYMREEDKPYEGKVAFIGLNTERGFMNVLLSERHMLQFDFTEIGNTVFFTREAAEKALKEDEYK